MGSARAGRRRGEGAGNAGGRLVPQQRNGAEQLSSLRRLAAGGRRRL